MHVNRRWNVYAGKFYYRYPVWVDGVMGRSYSGKLSPQVAFCNKHLYYSDTPWDRWETVPYERALIEEVTRRIR